MFGIYTYQLEHRNTVQDILSTAERINRRFYYTIRRPAWDMNYDQVRVITENQIRYKHIQAIVVKDERGEIIAGALKNKQMENIPFSAARFSENVPENSFLVKENTITVDNTYIGNYQIFFNDYLLRTERKRTLIRYALQVVLLAVIILSVVYLFLNRNVITPIARLQRAVSRFSTDRSVRTDLRRNDEIGELAASFNEMAGYIQSNDENLEEIIQLRTKQLAEAETMASLGGMVAGVAHEINTPMGNSLTAATHLQKSAFVFSSAVKNETATQDDLESFLETIDESTRIIAANLNRAVKLVRTFKKVAVDRSSEQGRNINLKSYIEDILLSLHPELKKTALKTLINCPDDLTIQSYPGMLSQVFTNLIVNSLTHGFEPGEPGTIRITAEELKSRQPGIVRIVYEDDGKGIHSDNAKWIYDPFFTTNRSEGSSGLGMNIVYNIITQKLHGKITLENSNKGVRFLMEIPIHG